VSGSVDLTSPPASFATDSWWVGQFRDGLLVGCLLARAGDALERRRISNVTPDQDLYF